MISSNRLLRRLRHLLNRSWILREVGAPLLEKIPWISTSETTSKEWYLIQAVLRVSLGNFLFFTILMIGVKDQNDRRVSWHHGGWTAKLVIWALLTVLMFFMPNEVITIYGILFIWFNPSGQDCGLNVFFLVMTMILAFAFAVIALHPQVNGCLLPASVRSVYCAYVCYTGLSSEPRDYVCNGLHNKSAVTTSTPLLGMLTTVLSVLYSALCAGSSTIFLSPPSSPKSGGKKPLLDSELQEGKEKTDETESRPVRYSYTVFHLIFALASMYSAMLLSGWTSSNESSKLIDVGWTLVWVCIVSEWVTAVLYVWTLIAPPPIAPLSSANTLHQQPSTFSSLSSSSSPELSSSPPTSPTSSSPFLSSSLLSLTPPTPPSSSSSSSSSATLRQFTYWVFALFILVFVFFEICCDPRCKALKKAMEFDLQLQTKECLRSAATVVREIDELPWKGGSEGNPDYECLRAELRKMAPPNERAVLLFQALCGCPIAKLEG